VNGVADAKGRRKTAYTSRLALESYNDKPRQLPQALNLAKRTCPLSNLNASNNAFSSTPPHAVLTEPFFIVLN
jgi:hypothetical protein